MSLLIATLAPWKLIALGVGAAYLGLLLAVLALYLAGCRVWVERA